MKRKIIFLFFILSTVLCFSQNKVDYFKVIPEINQNTPYWAVLMYSDNPNVFEVEKQYRAYYKVNPFVKTTHTQNYKYWFRKVAPFVDSNGYIKPVDINIENVQLKNSFNNSNPSIQTEGASDGWVNIGSKETFKAGTTQAFSSQVNIYAIDQSLSNSDLIICGTEAGGVYKSTNKGVSWSLITKDAAFNAGNSAIKIHPTDENNYLVTSSNRIYQTLDGGDTWTERHNINGEGNELVYSPYNNNLVYCTSSSGLFKSTNAGQTWTQEFTEACYDIEFHPTNNQIIYLLKSNTTAKRAEFFKSTDAGSTWTIQNTGWYTPSVLASAIDGGGKITTTPIAPNYVYACLIGSSKAGDNGWIGVYKSTDSGTSWINPSGQDGGPYATPNSSTVWNVAAYTASGVQQGFYNFDFEMSESDSLKLWIGTIRLTESTDGGQTFTSIGGPNSQRLTDIHSDIQDIEVIGNDIWIASDGGVNYSSDQLNSHVALNKGIQAAHFWQFNTGWNEDVYVVGKYHNGTSGWFEQYGDSVLNIGGVEEPSGYVHPIENRKLIFKKDFTNSYMRVRTIPENVGGTVIDHSNITFLPNEKSSPGEGTGFVYHPRYANHIITARNNKIYKSKNSGASFVQLFEFPNTSGKVHEIEISRSNPDVMYCSYSPGGGYWSNSEIWKSTDGGNTWTITTLPTGNRRRFRISIDAENENEVWICVPRGNNGNKVFKTTDGGSTWVNKTSSVFDGEKVTDIYQQSGTSDIVYVTTENSVFYWDSNLTQWIDYSTGLPLISRAFKIHPFYRDAELRLGTNGRGAWARVLKDTMFLPIAHPITYTDSVFCSRDTVKFDCYSILRHQGATWNWNITPAPNYISSTTVRNPKVVFGNSGNYTVQLTVTDANGNTSSKTIANMVNVSNGCEADSLAGMALKIDDNEYGLSIPNLNMTNVTHFTTTAWIKIDTVGKFKGIVSNGKWCAHCPGQVLGLTTNNGGTKLSARWINDGLSWSSSTGLVFPVDEWAYVAMVIKPDSMIVYLNEEKWAIAVNLNPININQLYVGKGFYNHGFYGEIDEVTLWKKALTQNEIREMRHLTKKDLAATDPDLIAYYQFNNQGSNGQIADVSKSNHGVLMDGTLTTSTAPVGPGTSERSTISTNGTFSFPNEGIDLDFSSSNPDGEIVLTRLNVQPDSLPNSNPAVSNYWIINNYGNNSSFNNLDSIKFKTHNSVSGGIPSDVILYTRTYNGHLNNWTNKGGASNLLNGKYVYDNSNNIGNFSQFFIQSANSNPVIKSYVTNNVDTAICNNQTIFLENQLQNTAGIYYDTIPVNPYLDSVVVTNLTILSTDSVTINSTTCNPNNAGTVVQNLTNQAGCDSIVTIITTLLASDSITLNETTCNPNDVGTVVQNLTNQAGCDSIVTTITTLNTPINSFITANGTTLTANPSGLQYQWINCDNNTQITGETNQIYEAEFNGSYAAVVSDGICSDTTDCYTVTGIGLEKENINNNVKIYPNPTNNILTIEFSNIESLTNVWMTNSLGQIVKEEQVNNANVLTFNMSDLSKGVYFVHIQNKNKQVTFKVIKQ